MKNISVEDLKAYEAEGKKYFLIDVREPEELETLKMEGMPYHHFPMSTFETYIERIPHDEEVVVFCKAGGRSARVVDYLEDKGFDNCTNLIGGMMAWVQSNE